MRDWRLIEFAKKMRREQTDPKSASGFSSAPRAFEGSSFADKRSLVAIADFSARDPMVVIEIDGDTHGSQQGYDQSRTVFFEERGYRVIRFTNSDVMTNMEGVLTQLALFVSRPPLPTLSPEGERAI